jgi:hypothetical protein
MNVKNMIEGLATDGDIHAPRSFTFRFLNFSTNAFTSRPGLPNQSAQQLSVVVSKINALEKRSYDSFSFLIGTRT